MIRRFWESDSQLRSPWAMLSSFGGARRNSRRHARHTELSIRAFPRISREARGTDYRSTSRDARERRDP